MTLTFVDSGLLIAAARGTDEFAQRAIDILDDPERQFISSDYVRLEILPKPVFNDYEEEADFYRAFFEEVSVWVESSAELSEHALETACHHGLSAVDALHVAAAERENAEELVTSEGSTKPLFRVASMKITSIRDGNGEDTA